MSSFKCDLLHRGFLPPFTTWPWCSAIITLLWWWCLLSFKSMDRCLSPQLGCFQPLFQYFYVLTLVILCIINIVLGAQKTGSVWYVWFPVCSHKLYFELHNIPVRYLKVVTEVCTLGLNLALPRTVWDWAWSVPSVHLAVPIVDTGMMTILCCWVVEAVVEA